MTALMSQQPAPFQQEHPKAPELNSDLNERPAASGILHVKPRGPQLDARTPKRLFCQGIMFICTGSETEIPKRWYWKPKAYIVLIIQTGRLPWQLVANLLHKEGALVPTPAPASQPGHFRLRIDTIQTYYVYERLRLCLAIRFTHLHANFWVKESEISPDEVSTTAQQAAKIKLYLPFIGSSVPVSGCSCSNEQRPESVEGWVTRHSKESISSAFRDLGSEACLGHSSAWWLWKRENPHF